MTPHSRTLYEWIPATAAIAIGSALLVGIITSSNGQHFQAPPLIRDAPPQADQIPTQPPKFDPKKGIESQIENRPITISVSEIGLFAQGSPWYLSINSAGQGELTLLSFPKWIKQKFEVSEKNWLVVRDTLRNEQFFQLADEQGARFPDFPITTISVTVGDLNKTIKFYSLIAPGNDQNKRRQIERTHRIFKMFRSWIDHPDLPK